MDFRLETFIIYTTFVFEKYVLLNFTYNNKINLNKKDNIIEIEK